MSPSCSCEGTLLIPSDPDRSSRWREHLMSGSRLTVVLEAVNGQRPGEGYLLWGESYRQEKLFEVNLRSVRSYVVRRRTWHEVTAKDGRKFALSFEDGETFAIFYERLENALKSLGKFTTGENLDLEGRDPGDGKIFVLRVDRVPPKKPPRFQVRDPDYEEIPGVDVCDGVPQSVAVINNFGPSTDLGDKTAVKLPESCVTGHDKRTSTIWYADICDINSQNNDSNNSELSEIAEENIYDSIGNVVNACNFGDASKHGMNSTAGPTTEACGNGRISIEPLYDNATSVRPIYSKPDRHKKKHPACANTEADSPTSPESRVGATESAARPTPKPRQRTDCGPSVAAAASPTESWTCERCTLINTIAANQCVVCGTRRDHPGEEAANHVRRLPSSYVLSSDVFHRLTSAAAAVDDGWQCSRCSARNCRESRFCRSCSAWVCGQCTLHNHSEHLACFTCASPKFHLV